MEPDELPALTADVIDDEELLGIWTDVFIRLDPAAQARAAEIELLIECLQSLVDARVWKLVVEVDARVTQRWADLACVLVQHAFAAGQRHPLLPGEVAP